ncbi:hypothetical protein V1293_004126 [Bradyrhizobium sp. AZCC 1693]
MTGHHRARSGRSENLHNSGSGHLIANADDALFEPTQCHGNTKSSIVYTRGSASADRLQKIRAGRRAPARCPDLAVKVGIIVELSTVPLASPFPFDGDRSPTVSHRDYYARSSEILGLLVLAGHPAGWGSRTQRRPFNASKCCTHAGISFPSTQRCFSSAAISIVISRDHPSAVLNATMRTG